MQQPEERLADLEERLKKYDEQLAPMLVFFDRGKFLGRLFIYICGAIVAIAAFAASIVSIVQWWVSK